jgi:hypothetical protein
MNATGPIELVSLAALSDGESGMLTHRDEKATAWRRDWERRHADLAGYIKQERRFVRVMDLRRSQRACRMVSEYAGKMGYVARLRIIDIGQALSRYARLDRAAR